MSSRILADFRASITKLQKDPIGTAASGNGAAVAILNRNALAFYCVPADEYHAMVDRLDDIELNAVLEARRGGPFVEVGLAELQSLVREMRNEGLAKTGSYDPSTIKTKVAPCLNNLH